MPEPAKNILVVDDDEDIRKLLILYLERYGYKVLTAGNGVEGMKLARQAKPDLVLLDVAIPDISGMELLKILKADPELKSIPVIMLSNYPLQKGVNLFLKEGALAYLDKWTHLKELGRRIMNILKEADRELPELEQSQAD